MTNWEKYKNEILTAENAMCKLCEIRCGKEYCSGSCESEYIENLLFLQEEHKEKIKLTKNEKAILESIDKDYKWIARDGNNNLYIYKSRSIKVDD